MHCVRCQVIKSYVCSSHFFSSSSLFISSLCVANFLICFSKNSWTRMLLPSLRFNSVLFNQMRMNCNAKFGYINVFLFLFLFFFVCVNGKTCGAYLPNHFDCYFVSVFIHSFIELSSVGIVMSVLFWMLLLSLNAHTQYTQHSAFGKKNYKYGMHFVSVKFRVSTDALANSLSGLIDFRLQSLLVLIQ